MAGAETINYSCELSCNHSVTHKYRINRRSGCYSCSVDKFHLRLISDSDCDDDNSPLGQVPRPNHIWTMVIG